jgi:hypothetical protein
MRLLRWLGGVVVLFLSAVGIIACVSGVIAVWVLSPRVSDKAQTILSRLDVGLQRVSDANQNVRRAIEQARAEVVTVNKESAGLGGGRGGNRGASHTLRTVIRQAAPNIDELGGRLATLSDGAVAASSLLESRARAVNGAPRVGTFLRLAEATWPKGGAHERTATHHLPGSAR